MVRLRIISTSLRCTTTSIGVVLDRYNDTSRWKTDTWMIDEYDTIEGGVAYKYLEWYLELR